MFNVVYFLSSLLIFSLNIDFEQEYYYSLNKTPNSRMYLTDSQDVSSFLHVFLSMARNSLKYFISRPFFVWL